MNEYLSSRQLDANLADRIVRLAKAITLQATYYSNVIVLLTNCLLAFAVFPSYYGIWVFLIFYVVGMLMQTRLGFLWQYEAIDITDDLPALNLPQLGVVSVELSLRLEQVAFNVFTVVYFGVGYWLAHGGAG